MNPTHTPPAAGKAAHTPTPWFPIPQNPRGTYWRITQEPTAAPYNCDVAQGITKEDATFIVTACNEFDKLVMLARNVANEQNSPHREQALAILSRI